MKIGADEKKIQKEGAGIVWRHLVILYAISLVVELFALWLFGAIPQDTLILMKIVIIGSYPAMTGAVSFSLI